MNITYISITISKKMRTNNEGEILLSTIVIIIKRLFGPDAIIINLSLIYCYKSKIINLICAVNICVKVQVTGYHCNLDYMFIIDKFSLTFCITSNY